MFYAQDAQEFFSFRSRSQVLTSALSNENAVLDAHAAHSPVPFKCGLIDVVPVLIALQEVRLDVRAAEIESRLFRNLESVIIISSKNGKDSGSLQ